MNAFIFITFMLLNISTRYMYYFDFYIQRKEEKREGYTIC